MIGAVNLGYSFGKYRCEGKLGHFPSVVGPASEDLLDGADTQRIVMIDGDGQRWFVGQEAIQQSVVLTRREGRDWIESDEYRLLWHAALSEMTTQFRPVRMNVVTGLPVNYFRGDRDKLRRWLIQKHEVRRAGRPMQQFYVEEAIVFPETMGALFALTITPDGDLLENRVATGRVAVIDVGGHNTGFLVADKMKPIRPETKSIDTGCWKIVSQVAAVLDSKYPSHGLRDHEIIEAIVAREIEYCGRPVDIGGIVDAAVKPVASEIMGVVSQLWNGGRRFRHVILVGGGPHLMADYIRAEFPGPTYPPEFVYVVGEKRGLLPELDEMAQGLDPIYGNAEGLYRYGLYKWG